MKKKIHVHLHTTFLIMDNLGHEERRLKVSETTPTCRLYSYLCALGQAPLSVKLPLPSEPLIAWNWMSDQKWRTGVTVTASLLSVGHHLSYTTKKLKTSTPSWKK